MENWEIHLQYKRSSSKLVNGLEIKSWHHFESSVYIIKKKNCIITFSKLFLSAWRWIQSMVDERLVSMDEASEVALDVINNRPIHVNMITDLHTYFA